MREYGRLASGGLPAVTRLVRTLRAGVPGGGAGGKGRCLVRQHPCPRATVPTVQPDSKRVMEQLPAGVQHARLSRVLVIKPRHFLCVLCLDQHGCFRASGCVVLYFALYPGLRLLPTAAGRISDCRLSVTFWQHGFEWAPTPALLRQPKDPACGWTPRGGSSFSRKVAADPTQGGWSQPSQTVVSLISEASDFPN